MNRLPKYSSVLFLLGLLLCQTPAVWAQVGPPQPPDTAAFRGNLFTLLQQQPLPYDQDLSNLPLFADATSSASLIQVRSSVKGHFHARHDEIVYILRGKGVMTVGTEIRAIQAGDLIVMRRGVVHKVVNKSAQPLVALSIMSPPFYGKDRIFTE